MTAGAALELRDFSAAYDRRPVLHDVSLDVAGGEVVCLIGANGAGKTTLLEGIAGILGRTDGSVLLDGAELRGCSSWDVARRGVALVPQGRRCFTDLTVEENLDIGAYRLPPKAAPGGRQRVYDLFPVLRRKRHDHSRTLSGGQQQMLAIGRAMMAEPRVLLLDEPSLGLAPLVVNEIAGAISGPIADSGVSVLLAEQNTHLAFRCASRGYALSVGRIVAEGSVDDLRAVARDIYFGQRSEVGVEEKGG